MLEKHKVVLRRGRSFSTAPARILSRGKKKMKSKKQLLRQLLLFTNNFIVVLMTPLLWFKN